jgi:hypothetical protein
MSARPPVITALRIAFAWSFITVFATTGLAQRPVPATESWPQSFEVPGHATFGFVVTQPGLITVTADWQGGALTARLQGPASQPQAQSGTGHVQLTYSVTAADVQRGTLWAVTLSAAGAQPPIGQPVVRGTLSVRHPTGDVSLAMSQLQTIAARNLSAAKLALSTQTKGTATPLAASNASVETSQAKQARLRPTTTVPVLVVQDFSAASLAAARQQLEANAGSATPPPKRAVVSAPKNLVASATPQGAALKTAALLAGPTPQLDAAQSRSEVAMVCCTWLDHAGAYPNAGYLWGKYIGTSPGELHFVASGNDISLPVLQWEDHPDWDQYENAGVITFDIPQILMAQQTDVQVYLKTSTGKISNRLTFHFAPTSPLLLSVWYSVLGRPDWVSLFGAFFGQSGEVHLVDKTGKDTQATIRAWAPPDRLLGSDVGFTVPLQYVLSGFDGSLYIKTRGMTSNSIPFHLDPAPIVTASLTLTTSGIGQPWSQADGIWPIEVAHGSDFFVGVKGDDSYFVGQPLINGWVVDGVSLLDQSSAPGLWGSARRNARETARTRFD